MRVRSALRKYVEALPWLFYKFRIIQRIFDSDNTFARLSDVAGDQGGVQSVTGDGISGTPEDVVITFPTAAEIGAIEDAPSDGKQYVRKDANWDEVATGTSNLADVLLEGNSADGNKITNLSDGVDAGDAVNKGQLDALGSPFEIVDVTQQVFSDIAIVVKDFDNIARGMTYQEGAIDFGVSIETTHEMGMYSFKVGVETEASGMASSAFGINTIASGDGSSAFGNNTTASGDGSSAFGNNTTASGDGSSAFGGGTIASGNISSAFGTDTIASGDFSSAFGGETKASGYASSAFGDKTKASGYASSAFGVGTESNEYASLAIGRYSTDGTAEGSWQNGSPIFKVGNGSNSVLDRKNAYVLYNDGRSEQEKDMEVTTIGQGFVLKSPDGTRWRITVDNDGSLITTELN